MENCQIFLLIHFMNENEEKMAVVFNYWLEGIPLEGRGIMVRASHDIRVLTMEYL